MDNKVKQFALLSILLSSVHNSTAGTMADVATSSNEFSAGAFFLRPDGSNDYAVLVNPFNANVAAPILSPSWEPKGIDPDFSPGFSLNFRHLFASSGNDINFYWAHLRTSDKATFPVDRQPPPAQQMTGPFWNIGPDAGTTSAASGELKTHYDLFNVEFGRQLNLATNLKSRIFAGLSGLWLEQHTDAFFSGTDPILDFYTFGIGTVSKYKAAGIRLGLEGEYAGFYNINPVGLLAGAIYIGSQQPTLLVQALYWLMPAYLRIINPSHIDPTFKRYLRWKQSLVLNTQSTMMIDHLL